MNRLVAASLLALSLTPAPALACASCGCTFAADWLAEGLIAQPGSALSLRWDHVPQTRLKTGTQAVDPTALTLPPAREFEQRTDNHYLTLAYDRQFASDWGFDAALPFVTRPHRTIAAGDSRESSSTAAGIGDIRLTARWQGLSTPGAVTGLEGGVVLPTGGFHRAFATGPQAGQPVDRGLQPGTGTVQAIAGVYHYRRLSPDLALAVQARLQAPLGAREAYRPGMVAEGSVALRLTSLGAVSPSLQLNVRANARDAGANADAANSGGEQLMLAPGLSARLTPQLALFALAQVPLYQRVNGWQLTPKATTSAGVQLRF